MKKILAWVKRRATERSTYIGLATIAAAVGLPGVAAVIGSVGTSAGAVLGAGLVAASTSTPDVAA